MVDAERTFLYLWRLELLEKITYFEDYLSEAKAELHHRDLGLLASLTQVLKRLKSDISRAFKQLEVGRTAWSDADVANVYTRLLNSAIRFLPVHHALYWVYTPWAEDETYSMLSSLFTSGKEQLYDRLYPTISFVSEFNCLHTELHQYWQNIPGLTARGALLAMPKIAKRDCLSWPLLAHELGHAIYESLKLSETLISQFVPAGIQPHVSPRIARWASEIVSDLIALTMFGPAFFFCFVASVIFFSSAPLRVGSQSHPSLWDRVEFMFEELKSIFETRLSDPNVRMLWDKIAFWKDLADTKMNLQRVTDGLWPQIEAMPEHRQLFDTIVAHISTLRPRLQESIPQFTVIQCLHAVDLMEPLRRRELISSSRSKDTSELARLLAVPKILDSDFDSICNLINDVPNEPATIINASWLLKVDEGQLLDRLVSGSSAHTSLMLEPDDHQDVIHSDDQEAAEHFRQRNWRIQKSIETSLLHASLNTEGTQKVLTQ